MSKSVQCAGSRAHVIACVGLKFARAYFTPRVSQLNNRMTIIGNSRNNSKHCCGLHARANNLWTRILRKFLSLSRVHNKTFENFIWKHTSVFKSLPKIQNGWWAACSWNKMILYIKFFAQNQKIPTFVRKVTQGWIIFSSISLITPHNIPEDHQVQNWTMEIDEIVPESFFSSSLSRDKMLYRYIRLFFYRQTTDR